MSCRSESQDDPPESYALMRCIASATNNSNGVERTLKDGEQQHLDRTDHDLHE
jgi:hypothetical protein